MSFSLETPRVENGYKKVMDLEVFYLICGYEKVLNLRFFLFDSWV